MCGIFGVSSGTAVASTIKGLRLLEYRGYDSAGVAIKRKNYIDLIKTVGRIDVLAKLIDSVAPANTAIGHTRWATHGKVQQNNAHPFYSFDKKFAVVHNGIISNYIELKQQLLASGVDFTSDTDSEVVAHLLAKNYEKTADVTSALLQTIGELSGSFALVVIHTDTNAIFAAKHGSPLCVGANDGDLYVCSDITTLRHFCTEVTFVLDDTVCVLEDGNVSYLGFDGGKKHLPMVTMPQLLGSDVNIESYMLKEIEEIPYRINDTFNSYRDSGLSIDNNFLRRIRRIYLVGCGTAYHAGLSCDMLFRQCCSIDVFSVLASEMVVNNYVLDKNCLVIFITQSGETKDTIEACEYCKARGAYTVALTNVVSSSITYVADKTIYINAGAEIAVASTKAYNCQLTALTLIAMDIGVVRGFVDREARRRLHEEFNSVAAGIERVVSSQELIEALVKSLIDSTSVYYLGRQRDLATAYEGSLKLKEISYVHSEAYASGELKHGTLALIEDGVTVVVVATEETLLEKYSSAVSEVLTRGAKVVVFTPFASKFSGEKVHVVPLPVVGKVFYPILSVVPLQLFAYYYAKLLGKDIDKPRNLAKAVTVE
jgi:glucosamine--fructose-6-phosphate aminotransferase (isomerizing)